MISKELLSEALRYWDKILDSETLSDFKFECNELSFVTVHKNLGRQNRRTLNIYELANRAKAWAYKQGYLVLTHEEGNFWIVDIPKPLKDEDTFWIDKGWATHFHDWYRSEPEAIFAACQWILDREVKDDKR